VDEPPRRTITRRSDEPKLKIGDIVAIKEGVAGMGVVKGFEMFFGFTAGRKLNKIQQLTAYPGQDPLHFDEVTVCIRDRAGTDTRSGLSR